MIVVIPAYEPDEKLLGVLRDFTEQTAYPVIVVNDGSSDACRPVFDAVRAFERVTLLTHDVNRGKGAAMKTAFAYIGEHYPASEQVITVDAEVELESIVYDNKTVTVTGNGEAEVVVDVTDRPEYAVHETMDTFLIKELK